MSDDIRYYDREAVKEAMLKAIKWGQERAETSVFLPEEVSDRYLRDNPGNVWDTTRTSTENLAKFQRRAEVRLVVRHTIQWLRDEKVYREYIDEDEADEIVESYLAANIPPDPAEDARLGVREVLFEFMSENGAKIAEAAIKAAIQAIAEAKP